MQYKITNLLKAEGNYAISVFLDDNARMKTKKKRENKARGQNTL